ncbi:MAG: formylmethanofuran--tetrahydromethanopterin formyltransferase [Crenarchaeota archaeon]|nr:formylmethanofuran--tetrahydromethanopterin formyltransferase [Thermoproteota archaeon]
MAGRIFERSFNYKGVEIEDVQVEAFDGLFLRVLVTAERGIKPKDIESPWLEDDELRWIAYRATSTPSIVVGRLEAGTEMYVPSERTPDKRDGVVIQYWYSYRRDISVEEQIRKFWREVSIRIRQDILSCSGGTSRLFNYLPKEVSVGEVDTYELVGKCGGGYERVVNKYDGREMIIVPLMSGFDFEIERKLLYGIGIAGAALWIFCTSVNECREACREAVKRLYNVEGCITPFGACPSGSLPENYPPIGPPTNYYYCPSLRNIVKNSKVPEGVRAIYEIVINSMDIDSLRKAIRESVNVLVQYPGVVGISAANYGGRLGRLLLRLSDLLC